MEVVETSWMLLDVSAFAHPGNPKGLLQSLKLRLQELTHKNEEPEANVLPGRFGNIEKIHGYGRMHSIHLHQRGWRTNSRSIIQHIYIHIHTYPYIPVHIHYIYIHNHTYTYTIMYISTCILWISLLGWWNVAVFRPCFWHAYKNWLCFEDQWLSLDKLRRRQAETLYSCWFSTRVVSIYQSAKIQEKHCPGAILGFG